MKFIIKMIMCGAAVAGIIYAEADQLMSVSFDSPLVSSPLKNAFDGCMVVWSDLLDADDHRQELKQSRALSQGLLQRFERCSLVVQLLDNKPGAFAVEDIDYLCSLIKHIDEEYHKLYDVVPAEHHAHIEAHLQLLNTKCTYLKKQH